MPEISHILDIKMTNEAEVVDFNYSSESKGPIVNTVCTIFMVLTAIVIGLRLFSRLWVVRAMGLDDSKLHL